MFTACTSESDNSPSANISYESVAAAQQTPVTFGTYMGETPTTRAGYVGVMTEAQLKETVGNSGGFGVFGYYTDHSDYVPASSPINFMYNQGVFWNTTNSIWEYTPIKYWPNETNSTYGTSSQVDGSATSSEGPDKLSFFAYAPYVSSASGTTGITAIPANTDTGDPKITYAMSQDALNSVDLMWAVSNAADNTAIVTGVATGWNIGAGMPFKNLVKPQLTTSTSTAAKVNFNFKHALARLALTVQATRDTKAVVTSGGTEFYGSSDPANKTKVMIETVTLSGKFPTTGKLNLDNTTSATPEWEIASYPTTNTDITINGSNMTPSLHVVKDGSSNVESAANQKSGSTDYAGVLVNSETPLLANDASSNPRYFMFIPNTTTDASTKQDKITVNIVYHVITDDTALDGGKVVITNNITKVLDLNLEAGKAYTLNLTLGMETVDFAATVTNWNTTPGSTPVDLPINVAPAAP